MDPLNLIATAKNNSKKARKTEETRILLEINRSKPLEFTKSSNGAIQKKKEFAEDCKQAKM